jgi:hypothetical protein
MLDKITTVTTTANINTEANDLRDRLAEDCPVNIQVMAAAYGKELSKILQSPEESATFFRIVAKMRYQWADTLLEARNNGK